MRGNGKIQLPGPQVQQPVGLMVAQPFNDLQVIMLVAAQVSAGYTAKERVAIALDICEEAVEQQFEIQKRIAKANVASAKRFEIEQRAAQGREDKPPEGILVGG